MAIRYIAALEIFFIVGMAVFCDAIIVVELWSAKVTERMEYKTLSGMQF